MATRPGRLLDKTFTSFTEASGRLEDTMGWITAAEELAHEVLKETSWLSKLCDERVHDLVAGNVEDVTANQSTALALYFRQLKRVNSHLGDVATAVVNPFDRIGFKPKD